MLKQFLIEQALKQRKKNMQVDRDYSVREYLERIPLYFDANKAGESCLVVVYEIHDSADNDGIWTVTVAEGKCTVSTGEPEIGPGSEPGRYDVKLYLTAEVYRRILNGSMEISKTPYATGAVRFFGNQLAHQELNSYLTIPKEARIAAV